MLTKEQLVENRDALRAQIEAHQRDIIALDGALQNCEYLMELYDSEPVEESGEASSD